MIDSWAPLLNEWVNGQKLADAQNWLQIMWAAQDGTVWIFWLHFCTEGNTQGAFCPGGLTDVRLFSGHTHPVLHLTTPNCVLCSSPWLSYWFDFLPCKLLAWRVLSYLSFLSLTCQRTVRSLFWVKPFLKMLCCTMNWLTDLLTDWLTAATVLIMFFQYLRLRNTDRNLFSQLNIHS